MTYEELTAVAAGAPMPVYQGWAVARPHSWSAWFGDRCEMDSRHDLERWGGRRFRVEVRELPE